MGIELVKSATRPEWAQRLTDAGYRVVVAMALHALDRNSSKQQAGFYHGGHGPLQIALCGEESPAALQKVKRAVRHLVEVGAIERTTEPGWGTLPVYRLTLDSINQPVLFDGKPKQRRKSA